MGDELRYQISEAPPELFPDRELRIVAVRRDDGYVQVEYRVTPALPPGAPYAAFNLPWWVTEAVDDLGAVYWDMGGAYGPSEDGESTRGTLSVDRPDPAARQLRIRFTPRETAEGIWCQPAMELLVEL